MLPLGAPLHREGRGVKLVVCFRQALPSLFRGGAGVGWKTISNHIIKKYSLMRADTPIRPYNAPCLNYELKIMIRVVCLP